MKKIYQILAVNPGSTSTKVSIFRDETEVLVSVTDHPVEVTGSFMNVLEQLDLRMRTVLDALNDGGWDLHDFDAVVGRGGLIRPVRSGTYAVCPEMIADLESGAEGGHASSLAGIIAARLGQQAGIPAYIVDPVIVDEMEDVARVTGMPGLSRKSIWHALNQKASARRAASELGRPYEDVNLIVAHLGGGITIGAHRKGRVIDVNNGLDGEGPLSPQRAGTLPAGELVRLCYSGKYSYEQMMSRIKGKAGLMAHLGTNDARDVLSMIADGDKHAELIYRAMAYQIAKSIGACYAVLKGKIDGIVITGGIAHDSTLVGWVIDYIGFMGKLFIYPGENEMHALAAGALRVLRGEDEALDYIDEAEKVKA